MSTNDAKGLYFCSSPESLSSGRFWCYLWVLWAAKLKENTTILRIYGFEGDAAGQAEVFTSHETANQNVALAAPECAYR